jgi:sialate O-acetylesterase
MVFCCLGWAYLSATCWFWAKATYDTYGVPLGLISTNYGGTAVEWWSSPDALSKCNHGVGHSAPFQNTAENPLTVGISNSQLWNAMIVPFLRTTIFGALWYQGEANAGASNYWCTFPAMVDDWRAKWSQYTGGQTNLLFPFGFVQLSTWNADNNAVASLRWQQTANFGTDAVLPHVPHPTTPNTNVVYIVIPPTRNIGYVPNTRQVNYFMAEAMDLGSPAPDHDIHPKNKQDVGRRLALGGRAIAYGEKSTCPQSIYHLSAD